MKISACFISGPRRMTRVAALCITLSRCKSYLQLAGVLPGLPGSSAAARVLIAAGTNLTAYWPMITQDSEHGRARQLLALAGAARRGRRGRRSTGAGGRPVPPAAAG